MLDKVADFYGAEVDDTIGRLQTYRESDPDSYFRRHYRYAGSSSLLLMFGIVTKVGSL